MQNTSVMFQGVCSSFMVLSWLDKKPTRERGEVPTDLRGGLTESKLRKSRKFGEKATADGLQESQKDETTFCRTLRRRRKWKQNCTNTGKFCRNLHRKYASTGQAGQEERNAPLGAVTGDVAHSGRR